jgi:hypothetical protein
MFKFLKAATPAAQVADALWVEVRDGQMTRVLAGAASEESAPSDAVLDEVIYFRSFVIDLTIHRVFQQQIALESALRDSFGQRLSDYAIARRCTPCPIGDWLFDNSARWEIHGPGRDAGDPLKHLSDRFDLYIAAMRRPTKLILPVVGVIAGLCRTWDMAFTLVASKAFVDESKCTQDFLRKIRVKV